MRAGLEQSRVISGHTKRPKNGDDFVGRTSWSKWCPSCGKLLSWLEWFFLSLIAPTLKRTRSLLRFSKSAPLSSFFVDQEKKTLLLPTYLCLENCLKRICQPLRHLWLKKTFYAQKVRRNECPYTYLIKTSNLTFCAQRKPYMKVRTKAAKGANFPICLI